MSAISSIIFNTLARRESVNLPEIGSLRVERREARIKSKGKLEIPVTRIVYSKNKTEGAQSIIDMVAAQSESNTEEAALHYQKWITRSRIDNVTTIDGVGKIKNDFFFPSTELTAIINPDRRAYLNIGRRLNIGRIAAILALVLLIVGGGYYLLVEKNLWSHITTSNSTPANTTIAHVIPATPLQPAISVDSLRADSLAALQADSNMVATPATTATIPTTVATPMSATTATFHLIAGVYSTSANAEKFISTSRAKDNFGSYSIIRSGSKFLVSVYSSSSEQTVAERKNQLRNLDPNMWIHREANR